ncbi:F0F1 ATP synthase subunit gamma [Desulfopila aestuarii]|uniref:F-type H+-transporting ATPase subunit gamma n=1 Tax=Desulfopila aestuarii DSM 18488 TaxID=1121416 RepID=A0A1M7YAH1_9BACT|nr:FoF1 ATP synthase subunit gamma [Desulfopila aestuarii]SHO49607.1 F-type H+-transporting ATPase subunit gamma [Desulfopila aestuarii DSM 18488]
MSRSRKIALHLQQLQELQAIISSMRTLAQLELHKLAAQAEQQRQMSDVLDTVIADFLYFYDLAGSGSGPDLLLVLGSERGFCGPFNEILATELSKTREDGGEPCSVLIVGGKLSRHLGEEAEGFGIMAGASTGEELFAILSEVVVEVRKQMKRHQAQGLRVMYHDDASDTVVLRQLLPPQTKEKIKKQTFPPHLYLEPDVFFQDFLQHYLFVGLIRLLTASLLVENRYRVQHLGGALHRLEERLAAMQLRVRSLRQEEITAEIEMILLGSGAFDLGKST